MALLEKAARALLASERNGEQSWDDLDVITRGAFLRDARAVLQAIREPEETMVDQAEDQEAIDPRATARNVWYAMIDAALKENE